MCLPTSSNHARAVPNFCVFFWCCDYKTASAGRRRERDHRAMTIIVSTCTCSNNKTLWCMYTYVCHGLTHSVVHFLGFWCINFALSTVGGVLKCTKHCTIVLWGLLDTGETRGSDWMIVVVYSFQSGFCQKGAWKWGSWSSPPLLTSVLRPQECSNHLTTTLF